MTKEEFEAEKQRQLVAIEAFGKSKKKRYKKPRLSIRIETVKQFPYWFDGAMIISDGDSEIMIQEGEVIPLVERMMRLLQKLNTDNPNILKRGKGR